MTESDVRQEFNRVERLVGRSAMQRIASLRVLVVGVGGVGSWTAEALVRSGVEHLTIVDADCVARSNINRQLMALTTTVGEVKVDVLRERLLLINPDAEIRAIREVYCEDTAGEFDLEEYDYIVDAIDSLKDKALLIMNATAAKRPRLFSSMGAARKLDPTQIRVDEFWSVKGCPLAAALRNKFKRGGIKPRRKFKCVYSPELVPVPSAEEVTEDTSGAMTYGKVSVNGAVCHITAIFGMTLAGLVIKHALERK